MAHNPRWPSFCTLFEPVFEYNFNYSFEYLFESDTVPLTDSVTLPAPIAAARHNAAHAKDAPERSQSLLAAASHLSPSPTQQSRGPLDAIWRAHTLTASD